jgi:hypothetical protein
MREPGFYWVRRESWSGEPEVAHYDGEAFYPCGDDRCAMEDSDDPVQVLSERLEPPGDLEASAFEKATGALFRAAKAERVTVHLRLSWPRQPGAKAAPTAAKSRAARTRR